MIIRFTTKPIIGLFARFCTQKLKIEAALSQIRSNPEKYSLSGTLKVLIAASTNQLIKKIETYAILTPFLSKFHQLTLKDINILLRLIQNYQPIYSRQSSIYTQLNKVLFHTFNSKINSNDLFLTLYLVTKMQFPVSTCLRMFQSIQASNLSALSPSNACSLCVLALQKPYVYPELAKIYLQHLSKLKISSLYQLGLIYQCYISLDTNIQNKFRYVMKRKKSTELMWGSQTFTVAQQNNQKLKKTILEFAALCDLQPVKNAIIKGAKQCELKPATAMLISNIPELRDVIQNFTNQNLNVLKPKQVIVLTKHLEPTSMRTYLQKYLEINASQLSVQETCLILKVLHQRIGQKISKQNIKKLINSINNIHKSQFYAIIQLFPYLQAQNISWVINELDRLST